MRILMFLVEDSQNVIIRANRMDVLWCIHYRVAFHKFFSYHNIPKHVVPSSERPWPGACSHSTALPRSLCLPETVSVSLALTSLFPVFIWCHGGKGGT